MYNIFIIFYFYYYYIIIISNITRSKIYFSKLLLYEVLNYLFIKKNIFEILFILKFIIIGKIKIPIIHYILYI